ncbi:MAG: DNA mismatch repair endonuclease MutL, partial [Pseudopedobacter saltans]
MDIIQLLPDNIANQIAAGEVIQRPASAVKELLENAVDAGATSIKLYIQDAGKALIQVVDNGKGMSETDARLAFERHATSKIRKIEDLFQIRTMGFRGEALASVAAVAQVELKTKRKEDELGSLVTIENSQVVNQEPCAAPDGTSIAMKNLFFNIPARRNFLKSNAAEMRHIVDEFVHVAMAFPDIFFALYANNQEMFHLEAGTLKQRVVQLLGNQLNSKLVSVKDQTDYLNIQGFIGKPEAARKTRGDQYFFVNGRFIRSPYLNHAVSNAFDQLLPKDSFPLYVLFIDLDPKEVDINVHPTKQEIKFEDEKIIYAFVQAAVKHALAQSSIAPSLDFSLNADIQQLDALNLPFLDDKKETAQKSDLYQNFTKPNQAHFIEKSKPEKNWQEFFTGSTPSGSDSGFPSMPGLSSAEQDFFDVPSAGFELLPTEEDSKSILAENAVFLQIQGTYILAQASSGFLIIHQQIAHERVLYEKYGKQAHGKPISIQQ